VKSWGNLAYLAQLRGLACENRGVRITRRSHYHLTRRHEHDPWKRVRWSTAVVAAVSAIGATGYAVQGLSWFDAFYQTVITITTVGYGEIGGDAVDRSYRVWSLILVLVGTGAALYTVSVVVEAVLEDNMNDRIRRRRMQKRIDGLSGHVIVAGWGRVGHSIGAFVRRMGSEVVVIDNDPEVTSEGYLRIHGEATEDAVLERAGIQRAHSLIAALPTDPQNVYVTLSARALCPNIYIVVRSSDSTRDPKFFQAGANRVVNPYEIGGSRMGAVAMQPNVAEFFDEVLHDDTHDVAVIELTVTAPSAVIGNSARKLSVPGDEQALVVAVRKGEHGAYLANPDPKVIVDEGDVIIAVGSAAQLRALGRHVGDAMAKHIQLGTDEANS
jgi:voltage-gated potassium channel